MIITFLADGLIGVGIFVTAVFSCRNGFPTFRQLKQPLFVEIVKDPIQTKKPCSDE
jgi:hypothetical protein